jgi:hypothetical protein
LRAEEVETWKKIVDDPGLPFACTILVDADVRPGHAYVEVSGARIDVGLEARLALVRNALGLNGSVAEMTSTNTEALIDSSVKTLDDEFGDDSHLDQHLDTPDTGEVEKE